MGHIVVLRSMLREEGRESESGTERHERKQRF